MINCRYSTAIGVILALLLSLGSRASAADLHVPAQFPTIQSAIDASNLLDTILVAPGTYSENISFNGKSVSLRSTDGPALTILDGSTLSRGPDDGSTLAFEQGETPLAVLDGFTIRGGSGRVITDATGTFSRGGGILIAGASPTIVNCVLQFNNAQLGAGIHAVDSVALNLTGIHFHNNGGLEGAGAYFHNIGAVILNGCTFNDNDAQTAGGALTVDGCTGADVLNCTFTGNGALIGGAIDAKTTSIQVFDCEFNDNQATLIGGAATFFQSPSNVVSCNFFDNVAGHGAAIGVDGSSVILQRSVIANNFATSQGGAIASTLNSSTLNLSHMTIANNNSLQGSSGIYIPLDPSGNNVSSVLASHSIFWNPLGSEINIPGTAQLDYCDVRGGYPGNIIIDGNPGFTDPATRDYSLQETSNCVDAGSPLVTQDQDGTLPALGAIWHDQRPSAATDLACTLVDTCTNSYGISWTLTGNVDAVMIYMGPDPSNMAAVASLPGTASSWTTNLTTPGTPTICVEPLNNGMAPATGATCCQVVVDPIPDPIAISGLGVSIDHETCTATLSWINGESYTSLDLTVNGSTTPLAADATSTVLALDQDVATTMSLVATTSCGDVLGAVTTDGTCIAPPPDAAANLVCSLTDFCTNSHDFSWTLSGNVDSVNVYTGPDAANLALVDTLAGDATGWSTILAEGTQSICIEPINNGVPPTGGSTCCEVAVAPLPTPIPTSALTCSVNHDTCEGTVSWSNGESYSSLLLTVNGIDQVVAADATSALVSLPANLLATVSLTATSVCGDVLPEQTCELTCIPPDTFKRGDANADGALDIADVMFSLEAIFGGGASSCQDAQDTNDDGMLDISDPLLLLIYLYNGGTQPPAPGLVCGDDPTTDDLECPGSPGCP